MGVVQRRLWQEGKRHIPLLAVVAGAGSAVGGFAVVQAYIFAAVVDGVFLGGLAPADMTTWIYALVAAMVTRAASAWLLETSGNRLALAIKADLRSRLLDHLSALGPVHGGAERTGELVNILSEGIESLEAYFARYLPHLAVAVVVPLAVLAAVAPLDATVMAVMLVTAPLIPVLLALIGHWAGELHQRRWQVLNRLSGHFLEVLQGLTTLKLFGRSREQAEIVFAFSEEFRRTTLGVLRVAFLSALTLELISTVSVALVAVIIGLKLLYGGIGFREAFFILLLAPEFYLPFRMLGAHFHAGAAALAAMNKINELLAAPLPASAAFGDRPFAAPSGVTIEFIGVDYTYPGKTDHALRALSFKLPAGRRIAVVGPSGAGKTTVINLLLGFAAPTGGAIIANGRDLRQIRREDWLSLIAYIPQFPHLFAGTVAENIRLGAAGADEALREAASAAGVHEFISRLPQGYDTRIGAGGIGLSGGESQRIAIARAFFRQAAIIIFDEATSALDPRTEQAVGEAVAMLLDGRRTVLTIAHRLATVSKADQIVVLDQGRVVEQGRHDELAACEGVYSRLVAAGRGRP